MPAAHSHFVEVRVTRDHCLHGIRRRRSLTPNHRLHVGSQRGKRKILSGRQALPAAVGLGHFFKMYEVTQTISIANRQSPANQSPYWT